jgi:hypothetical protein
MPQLHSLQGTTPRNHWRHITKSFTLGLGRVHSRPALTVWYISFTLWMRMSTFGTWSPARPLPGIALSDSLMHSLGLCRPSLAQNHVLSVISSNWPCKDLPRLFAVSSFRGVTSNNCSGSEMLIEKYADQYAWQHSTSSVTYHLP